MLHGARRDPDRPADPAPARRLPRDRHARLRRDHPAVRPQRRQPARLRPHARHVRHHPDRLARLRRRRCTTPSACRSRTRAVDDRAGSSTGPRSLLLLFTIFCSIRLRDSRLGRAWIAIREDETAAAAMGIPLMRTKTWAYAIGAFFGGVAGAYFASFKRGAFPSDFYFNISVFLLCMVILGGMGSVWGVVVGGRLPRVAERRGAREHRHLAERRHHRRLTRSRSPKYKFGIYGVIIVLMMLFRPAGLIPERRHKRELEEGTRGPLDEPLYEMRGAMSRTDERDAEEPVPEDELAPTSTATCSIAGRAQGVRRPRRRQRRRLHDPERLDRQPDRPERRRQDDVLQHAHRRLQADRRRRSSSTAPT